MRLRLRSGRSMSQGQTVVSVATGGEELNKQHSSGGGVFTTLSKSQEKAQRKAGLKGGAEAEQATGVAPLGSSGEAREPGTRKSARVALQDKVEDGEYLSPEKQKKARVTHLLATWSRYPEGTKEKILETLKKIPRYEACCIALDHHKDGTPHFHAYVKFESHVVNVKTWLTLFDCEGHHADIKLKKGQKAVQHAVAYVFKRDKDPLIKNLNPEAIMKNLHERKYNCEQILTTDIVKLVKENAISARDYNAILKAQRDYKARTQEYKDSNGTRGIWIVGPPGCGKSHCARHYGEKHGGYYPKLQNKWWDGYSGEPIVVLDDLDSPMLTHLLKIWTDKWKTQGECKGSTIPLTYKWFIVTSNYSIQKYLEKADKFNVDYELLKALERRFQVIDFENYPGRVHFEVEDIEEVIEKIEKERMDKPLESSIGQESLPKEPSLKEVESIEEIEPKRPPPSITEISNELPPLLDDPDKDKITNHQPSTSPDSLDLMSSSEHIDWSGMRAECHNDPEEEVTDAIPEGDESDPEEEEPSDGDLNISSSY